MPIEVEFLSNTRKLERGTDDVGRALAGVSDSLDDVARDAERSLGRLERSFDDIARAAKDTERATEDVADKGTRGFSKLGDKGAEVSGELRQNLGETFSSFRGDLEDLPQIAQDTLGGLAGSGALGGIAGLAATAAGAAGLGLIIGAFEEIDEANQLSQERIGEWADKYIEAGGRVLSAGQIIAAANEIITDPEKFKTASENAELWGVSVATAILAQAGQEESIRAVSDALDAQRAAFERTRDAGELSYDQQAQQLDQLGRATGAYSSLTAEMEAGAARADIMSQALANVADHTADATREVDEFGDTIVTLPDGKQIYIDAETGKATENTEAIEKKIYSLPDQKNIKVTVDVDQSAYDQAVRTIQRNGIAVRVVPVASGRTLEMH
ncbi:hypothetical protein [Microbacterium sp. F2]|uniref:hypothetical protein n=1 Tax=Microbacterium sp. F2 TaxID=3422228 RepID=UPI003FD10B3B